MPSVLPLLRAPASCLSFVCEICGYRIRDSGLTMEDRGEVVNLRGHTARWQALQKYSPVSFGAQTRVKHSEHTLVARAANQSPQALLQGDDCLRNAVFMETRSAC